VLLNLMGREVPWISQRREDRETPWRDALRHHGRDALVASAWGGAVLWIAPAYFWWLTPVIVALVLSVPLSVLSSRVSLGEAGRRRGLFLTPEETAPARELRDLYIAAVEMNADKRRQMIWDALKEHNAQVHHVPLHRQMIPWAMRSGVTVVHRPDNVLNMESVRLD